MRGIERTKGFIEWSFKAAGKVTTALRRVSEGDTIGFRDPYGNSSRLLPCLAGSFACDQPVDPPPRESVGGQRHRGGGRRDGDEAGRALDEEHPHGGRL
jgi:hypothetical protein